MGEVAVTDFTRRRYNSRPAVKRQLPSLSEGPCLHLYVGKLKTLQQNLSSTTVRNGHQDSGLLFQIYIYFAQAQEPESGIWFSHVMSMKKLTKRKCREVRILLPMHQIFLTVQTRHVLQTYTRTVRYQREDRLANISIELESDSTMQNNFASMFLPYQ